MAEEHGVDKDQAKEREGISEKQKNEPHEGESPESSKEDKEKEENERFLRLAAEFDNYKKRTAKEIIAAKEIGRAELIKKLLPTLDEFEIAINSMPAGEAKKGIELIYSNFVEALKGEGLKEIEVKGAFDPYKHEIVMVKEDGAKDGTILEVVRKGYVLGDLVLRPASVVIAKERQDDNAGKEAGPEQSKNNVKR
ncbi:MAG: nucleotide exchange factor GrpE [Candidatus Micrarchaeaceae archaeon]